MKLSQVKDQTTGHEYVKYHTDKAKRLVATKLAKVSVKSDLQWYKDTAAQYDKAYKNYKDAGDKRATATAYERKLFWDAKLAEYQGGLPVNIALRSHYKEVSEEREAKNKKEAADAQALVDAQNK